MSVWYAVQESRDDSWDNGSYSYIIAKDMANKIAKKTGKAIVVGINEKTGVCVYEESVIEINNEENTLKPKIGFKVRSCYEPTTDTEYKRVMDGDDTIVICKYREYLDYEYNKKYNTGFFEWGVFTTISNNTFVWWSDENIDEDYITRI